MLTYYIWCIFTEIIETVANILRLCDYTCVSVWYVTHTHDMYNLKHSRESRFAVTM